MATEHLCMELGKPSGDSTPVQLSDDIWTQAANHGPGNSTGPIEIINRSIIYRLHPDDGDPFLVVLNALNPCDKTGEPIEGLKKLADELGAPIEFVLTPGSGHHLSLGKYAEALPDARVCIPAGRIERHNTELLELPNVETYTADTVPAELSAAGLEVLVWEGLFEGPVAKKFARTQFNFSYTLGDIQPQAFLHVPTGTITNGGHHMWYRSPDGPPVFKVPGMVKFMMKVMMGVSFDYMEPGKLSCDPIGGYTIADRDKVQASAKKLLGWKFDKMIDIHAALDSQLESGAYEVFEESIRPIANGDWDNVPFGDA